MADRVNRITATLVEGGDSVRLTMYKNNNKVGEINSDALNIPNYSKLSNMPNKAAYMEWCKDVLKQVIDNGGIDGVYYDEGEIGVNSKVFTSRSFISACKDMIYDILDPIYSAMQPIVKTFDMPDDIQLIPTDIETYKNSNIRNAKLTIPVIFQVGKKDITINVYGEIKSGQLCKIKSFGYEGQTYGLSLKNVRKVIG